MSAEPQILAKGTLQNEPLATLLVRIYDAQLAGTLILQSPSGNKSAILFDRGAPAKARVAEGTLFLGEVLVDLGLIDRRISARTRKLAAAAEKTHGQLLLKERHLDATGLYLGLREQLKRQVLQLCDLPDTTSYGLYRANYLSSWGDPGSWRVKPLPLMWRALVEQLPIFFREKWLSGWGDTVLRLRSDAPVNRYEMTRSEMGVLNMIRAQAMSLEQLESSGVGDVEDVRRVVSALLLSRQLERDGQSKGPLGYNEPPETPGSVAPPPARTRTRPIRSQQLRGLNSQRSVSSEPSLPANSSPDFAELRQMVQDFKEQDPVTHYDVLDIPRDATSAQVRAAFFRLARLWHPDRLPSELADLKAEVSSAFSRITDAHQNLGDSRKKAAYDEKLLEVGDGKEEQEQVALILNAATAYQKAEVLVRKKSYQLALKEAKSAFEADSTQAEYQALYGWLLTTQPDCIVAEALTLLDEAVLKEPENTTSLWFRGQVRKKIGQEMKAQGDFKKIVQLKPHHTDAAREIRVFRMRRRSDGSTKTTGGLFNRGKK